MLTLEQRIHLIQCYGLGEASYAYVINKFHERFPTVAISVNGLKKLVKKFTETGSVQNLKKKKLVHDHEDAATLLVLDSVNTDNQLSLRKRSTELSISKSHMQRILKENKILPFKPTFVHKLEAGDDGQRLLFCLWAGEKILNDRYFYKKIIFTDESTFTTNGIVSSQNCRYWSDENPHFRIVTNSQRYKKVNVWCAIRCDKIIGPYFFDTNLNQHSYLNVLENFFLPAMEDVNLEDFHFQQDGCPAHSTRLITNFLNQHFPERWIGRHGPIHWPARSPDLTPMDFYLWGYLKQKVYSHDLHDNIDLLKQKIGDAVAEINQMTIAKVYDDFRVRLEKCAELGGSHIE